MKKVVKKRARSRPKSFKMRLDEAIERDKKSRITENDREFLKKLSETVEKL